MGFLLRAAWLRIGPCERWVFGSWDVVVLNVMVRIWGLRGRALAYTSGFSQIGELSAIRIKSGSLSPRTGTAKDRISGWDDFSV